MKLKFDQDSIEKKQQQFIEKDQLFLHEIRKIVQENPYFLQKNQIKFEQERNKQQQLKRPHLNFTSPNDQQCCRIDQIALFHQNATTINKNSHKEFSKISQQLKCKCGCKKANGSLLSLSPCCNQQQMYYLGQGLFLFFYFHKKIITIMVLAVIIYGIYALVTNFTGNEASQRIQSCQNIYCYYSVRFSMENKIKDNLYSQIQAWLGVLFCIIWVIFIRFLKITGLQKVKKIRKFLKISESYTILIQNLPQNQYQQNELIQYLEQFYQINIQNKIHKILNSGQKNTPSSGNNDKAQYQNSQIILIQPEKLNNSPNYFINNQNDNLKLKNKALSLQIIYNMSFYRKSLQKIILKAFTLDFLLKQSTYGIKNIITQSKIQKYKQQKFQLCQQFQDLKNWKKQFLTKEEIRKQIATKVALLQFKSQKLMEDFLKYYKQNKLNNLYKIKQKIKKFFTSKQSPLLFKGKILQLKIAPQSEDIVYEKCQKQSSLLNLIVFIIKSLIIIIISFGGVFLISWIKVFLKFDILQKIGSYLTTVFILFMNVLIQKSLNTFIQSQPYYLITYKTIAKINRLTIFMFFNLIIAPIISILFDYKNQNNFYGEKGLNGIIFQYQAYILSLSLIAKLFNLKDLWLRLKFSIKSLRLWIIKFDCKYIKINKQILKQKGVPSINFSYQGLSFDIAQNYTHMICTIYHAVFYCRLQPILLVLVVVFLFIFYWINKYKVFRRCKIPNYVSTIIFDKFIQDSMFMPIIFAIGSSLLNYIQIIYDQNENFKYIPYSICAGIGLIGFINPFNIIDIILSKISQKICCSEDLTKIQNQNYPQKNQYKQNRSSNSNKHNNNENTLELGINKQKQQEKAKLQQIFQQKQAYNIIINDYYGKNNIIQFFNFQQILQGKKISNQELIYKHKQFCQSFFNSNKVSIKLIDLIKQNNSTNTENKRQNNPLNNQNEIQKNSKSSKNQKINRFYNNRVKGTKQFNLQNNDELRIVDNISKQ